MSRLSKPTTYPLHKNRNLESWDNVSVAMTQPQASSFDKISPTAFMATLARQFTDIPYAKELAQLVEAQKLLDLSLPQNQDIPVGATVHVEARYKAIKRVMAQYQTAQVLELASGLLPRGLFMSGDPNITFIESDLPAMIRCKQQLVQQLNGSRPNLHFLEIDATNPSQFLQSADYLKAGQPVVILCEGLLVYLTQAEKQQVCANVREMLYSYGSVWITCDFTPIAGLNQSLEDDPAFQKRVQTIINLTGRSPDDHFQTLDQARQFACEQGFRVAEHSMLDVMDQLSCLDILNIDAKVARKMLAAQSVFALTLDAA